MLKRNTIANFVGKGWSVAIGIVFVPLYIKYLGMESFGLVGFYTMLMSITGLLQGTLGSTLTREMAKLSGLPGKDQQQRDFLRTLEVIFWMLSLVIGGSIFAMASPIAEHWVRSEHLPVEVVRNAVRIMGPLMAFEFFSIFYQGGLMGLQSQVAVNLIRIGTTTLRSVGVLGILAWVSPTIEAFFLWNLTIGILQAAASWWCLWHGMPAGTGKPVFFLPLLAGVWRYTVGILGTSLACLILAQFDRMVLSKVLTLESFGFYTLAAAVAGGMQIAIGPLFSAVFPKLSQLHAQGDQEGTAGLYHKACQFMTVTLMPLAMVLAVFAQEVLVIWTRSAPIAEKAWLITSVLVVSTAMSALATMPQALQLANGWTRLGFFGNWASVAVLVPLTIVLALKFGPVGAAWAQLAVNTGFLLAVVPIMHRRLLPGHLGRWLAVDLGLPAAACGAIVAAARFLLPTPANSVLCAAQIVGIWALASVGAGLTVPWMRHLAVSTCLAVCGKPN